MVVQLVRTPACHVGGRGFKSRPPRQPSRHFSVRGHGRPSLVGAAALAAALFAPAIAGAREIEAERTQALATASPQPPATRAEEARRQREEKARRAGPPRRPWLERLLLQLEDRYVLDRLFNAPRGFYIRAGGITEGSGLGFGPAFRASVPHATAFTVSGAASIKGYWIGEASLSFPNLRRGRGFADAAVRALEFPQEDFYGLGPDSSLEARTNYARRETAVSVGGGVRPADHLAVGGRIGWLHPRIGRGTDTLFPSTDALFDDTTAPGLAAQPDFLHAQAFVRFDDSRPAANPRAGRRYSATFGRWSDRDLDRYSFDRFEVDLQQYLPLLHEYRVVALRALLSTTGSPEGHEVPFYLQQPLGGAYTLRGFPTSRFRAPHLLLLQAEYRWEINAFMHGALFVDAGKVAAVRGDLDLKGLDTDWGVGLRVGSDPGVVLRVDVAFGGREGTRFFVRGGHVF